MSSTIKVERGLENAQISPPSKTRGQRILAEIRGYIEALIIAFLIVTFVFNTVGVVGSSMSPNLDGGVGSQNMLRSLLTGDRVFIPKYDTWLRRAGILGDYQRGDVVVVREPANSPTAQLRERRPFFIKRVIGLPGDRIRVENGQVYVNNQALNQSFITSTGEIKPDPIDFPVVTHKGGQVNGMVIDFLDTGEGFDYPDLPHHNAYRKTLSVNDPKVSLHYGSTLAALEPVPTGTPENEPFILDIIVPENHYFVMGDNREAAKGGSEDSRYFGPIKAITIGGKASAVIWPPQREGQWNWRRLSPPEAFSLVPNS